MNKNRKNQSEVTLIPFQVDDPKSMDSPIAKSTIAENNRKIKVLLDAKDTDSFLIDLGKFGSISVGNHPFEMTNFMPQDLIDTRIRKSIPLRAIKPLGFWSALSCYLAAKTMTQIDRKHAVPLLRLARFTDWVPSRKLRKDLKKLVADDATEIQVFQESGRVWLARWRKVCTCTAWVYMVFVRPFSSLFSKIIKRVGVG